MASRIDLSNELKEMFGTSVNRYYQPPENTKMSYPAIKYEHSGEEIVRADDCRYGKRNIYELTVMDWDPDSTIYEQLLDHFQYCTFDRKWAVDSLNHWSLRLYY